MRWRQLAQQDKSVASLEARATTHPGKDLKGRALRLLSTREHSRLELERKLLPFEQHPGSLALVLDDLQTKGFISDTRVLESVIHRRAAKQGSARIRQELQARGLESQAITQAVSALRATDLARAQQVWRKKYGIAEAPGLAGHGFSLAERNRQIRFLLSRGFAMDTIRQVIATPEETD